MVDGHADERGAAEAVSAATNRGFACSEGLHARYVHHAQQQGAAFRSSQTKLGIFLEKQLGDDLKTMRPTIGHDRPWCYQLPSLKECREMFAAALGRPVDWGRGLGRTNGASRTGTSGITFEDWPVRPN